METIQEHPILEFNPNAIEEIRRAYDLHQPGVMAEVIDTFEEWIQKQSHFIKKNFSRRYLETSLILSKGSLERAKCSLDKLCTMKTLKPDLFREHNVKNLSDFTHFTSSALLPKPMKDHYRILMVKYLTSDFESPMFYEYYKYIMLLTEYIKLHDYVMGFTAIFDYRHIENIVHFAMKINVVQFREVMTALMGGHGVKLKGIHLISNSKAIDVLIAIIKQVVSSKISGRIRVHKTLEELYEHVPKELLPEEYGGEEKPLKELHDDWFNLLSAETNLEYFKDIFQAGTNEAYRQIDKYNDQVLGMPGSFRTLRVD